MAWTRTGKAMVMIVGAAWLGGSSAASAAELFRSQMSSAVGWGIHTTTADYSALIGYDYSDDFIPEAPNSRGGDAAQRGVKFQANVNNGVSTELSMYPMGQNFTGEFRLRFDAWLNYDADEAINGLSNGTTELIGGGVGYDNTGADLGAVGVQTAATGDGGSSFDWRVYNDGLFIAGADMEAGDRNGFDPYYSDFLPGVVPPGGQSQTAFPAGRAGSPGFQWVTFELIVRPTRTELTIEKPGGDRLLIAVTDTTPAVTDGNIMLYYGDIFSSISPRPDLTFGIIDNVQVDTEIPEPATLALMALGGLAMVRRSKRRVR